MSAHDHDHDGGPGQGARTHAEPAGPHDMGGMRDRYGEIDATIHDIAHWEKRVDAMSRLLIRKGLLPDFAEIRAGIEALTREDYDRLGYYERWSKAFRRMLVNKGILSEAEIETKMAEVRAALEARE